MAYCTRENVRARLPKFPDDADHNAVIDEGIEAAESEVDAALASRYSVPFEAPVPKVIKHITADLAAAWSLDTVFSGGGEEKETKLSDSIRRRALKRLKEIKEGTWRGINTLVSRDSVPGQKARPGILTSTDGSTSKLQSFKHPGLS